MRSVAFTRTAQRALASLPADVRQAMIAILTAYATGNDVDAKGMRGRPGVRLRVGEYRAIVEVTRTTITVIRIGHRSTVYRP